MFFLIAAFCLSLVPKGKALDMTADWQKLCTPDMIINAHDDHSEVWKEMYKKSAIDVMDLVTIVSTETS